MTLSHIKDIVLCENDERLKDVKCFYKKLHHRWLKWSQIRLWSWICGMCEGKIKVKANRGTKKKEWLVDLA